MKSAKWWLKTVGVATAMVVSGVAVCAATYSLFHEPVACAYPVNDVLRTVGEPRSEVDARRASYRD